MKSFGFFATILPFALSVACSDENASQTRTSIGTADQAREQGAVEVSGNVDVDASALRLTAVETAKISLRYEIKTNRETVSGEASNAEGVKVAAVALKLPVTSAELSITELIWDGRTLNIGKKLTWACKGQTRDDTAKEITQEIAADQTTRFDITPVKLLPCPKDLGDSAGKSLDFSFKIDAHDELEDQVSSTVEDQVTAVGSTISSGPKPPRMEFRYAKTCRAANDLDKADVTVVYQCLGNCEAIASTTFFEAKGKDDKKGKPMATQPTRLSYIPNATDNACVPTTTYPANAPGEDRHAFLIKGVKIGKAKKAALRYVVEFATDKKESTTDVTSIVEFN